MSRREQPHLGPPTTQAINHQPQGSGECDPGTTAPRALALTDHATWATSRHGKWARHIIGDTVYTLAKLSCARGFTFLFQLGA